MTKHNPEIDGIGDSLPYKDADDLTTLNELLQGDNKRTINELFMKHVRSVHPSELYAYDFATTVSEHISVRKSSLMMFFCENDSLLRQCYLLSNFDEKINRVTLDFGYVGLQSEIQYLRIVIENGMVAFEFTFGGRVHEVTREVSTIPIKVDSNEFVTLLEKIAAYLLHGHDDILDTYIQEDKSMEDLEKEEDVYPLQLMFGL